MAVSQREARRARVLSAILALLAAGAISACGSATDSKPNAVKPAAHTTAAPPTPPGQLAKSVVRSYYRDVNSERFGAAWSHFSPELRRAAGGFYSWRSGYDLTTHTTLASLRTIRASARSAVEQIRLVGDAVDACGRNVSQTFAGTWTLENRGGRFVGVALDVDQVAGDELVSEVADCPPPTTTVEPPPAPPPSTTTSSCDPNYAGACVPADASDVDCAGGSGDGPEYVGPVQVVGSDPYGLDADGDGYACES
jgi:hypothetical protein